MNQKLQQLLQRKRVHKSPLNHAVQLNANKCNKSKCITSTNAIFQQHKPPKSQQVEVQQAQFASFEAPNLTQNESRNLNLLLDIPLQVTVELGRTKRTVKDILELTSGSIIELDKLAGEPVDILVNNRHIAKGEVVVIDENFGVRITDILSQAERINNLR